MTCERCGGTYLAGVVGTTPWPPHRCPNPVVRPPSVPKEGDVPAFDAGWEAHEIGLARDTVAALAAEPRWALLGYDCRAEMAAL